LRIGDSGEHADNGCIENCFFHVVFELSFDVAVYVLLAVRLKSNQQSFTIRLHLHFLYYALVS
jgi:hypothetical protein